MTSSLGPRGDQTPDRRAYFCFVAFFTDVSVPDASDAEVHRRLFGSCLEPAEHRSMSYKLRTKI
jgi:hypothetical protein